MNVTIGSPLGFGFRRLTQSGVIRPLLVATLLVAAGCKSEEAAEDGSNTAGASTTSDTTADGDPPSEVDATTGAEPSASDVSETAQTESDAVASAEATSSDATSDATSDSVTGEQPAVDPNIVVGTFAVEHTGQGTSVQGKVKNGPDADYQIWDVASTAGDCELRTPRIPSCMPACPGSEVCVEVNTCRAAPASVSVGDVTISGVSHAGASEPVKLRSIVKNYQTPGDVTWDSPGFAAGDPIGLSASGGELEPFEIEASGVTPLLMTSDTPELAGDAPIELSWEPEVAEVETRLYVRIDISHHGGTRGLIECDTADDGSLTIDGSLLQGLIDQGVSGFPNIRITRSNIGSVPTPLGIIELKVNSLLQQDITIEGLASCNTDEECPAGTLCETDRVCR
jgi:hypothetical protein